MNLGKKTEDDDDLNIFDVWKTSSCTLTFSHSLPRWIHFINLSFRRKIFHKFSGLYYKTITIIIKMIVSDATIWSVIFDNAS